jgi:hypothetical protein
MDRARFCSERWSLAERSPILSAGKFLAPGNISPCALAVDTAKPLTRKRQHIAHQQALPLLN